MLTRRRMVRTGASRRHVRGKVLRRRGKALVFGDDTRSFLAVVRSLGRGGIEVHAAPADLTSPSLHSRFVAAVHQVPAYTGDGGEWCDCVERLLRDGAFDLVIPCDERTLLPLDRHRDVFGPLSRLAIPERDVVTVLFDKHKTRELAISLEVPVAPGRMVSPEDDAERLVGEFGLPLVIKPISSYTLDTIYARGRAGVLYREVDVARALPELRNGSFLVEGYWPGRGGGVSILAHTGRVLQAFQHMRARERSGASFYRKSAPLSENLVSAVQKIVAATRFTGVAMFEFKLDAASGSWVLLEVNARPWGSMPLPLALGIDFPLRWYRLLVDGEETTPRTYRAGIYQRNLVPDMRQILTTAKDCPSPIARMLYFLRAVSELRRVAVGREHLDALVADDPAPGFHELFGAVAGGAGRLIGKLPFSRGVARWRDRARLRRVIREARGAPAVVLLLCSGNICRSPFAAELLRRSLFDHARHVEVVGAGLLPRNGACSPEAAVIAAGSRGIDLTAHRSAYLSEREVKRASLIVLFDRHNWHHLRARHPEALQRTVMLGSFFEAGWRMREIADPDGCDLATFEETFETIARAIAGLATAIERARTA